MSRIEDILTSLLSTAGIIILIYISLTSVRIQPFLRMLYCIDTLVVQSLAVPIIYVGGRPPHRNTFLDALIPIPDAPNIPRHPKQGRPQGMAR